MKNSLKICKYQLSKSLKVIGIYYGIICVLLMVLVILDRTSNFTIFNQLYSEYYTIILLFILGLGAIKKSFNFAQGNNVSRKSYYKGVILHIFRISALLPPIEIIINRIYNLYIYNPMIFDRLYDENVKYRVGYSRDIIVSCIPSLDNSVSGLVSNYLFLFSSFLFILIIGFLISIIMYKLKGVSRVVFSIIIGFIFINRYFTADILPADLINYLLKIDISKSYNAVITNLVISIIIIVCGYLLLRRTDATGYKTNG